MILTYTIIAYNDFCFIRSKVPKFLSVTKVLDKQVLLKLFNGHLGVPQVVGGLPSVVIMVAFNFTMRHSIWVPTDKRNYFIAGGVLGAVGLLNSLGFKDQFLGVAVIEGTSLIIDYGLFKN